MEDTLREFLDSVNKQDLQHLRIEIEANNLHSAVYRACGIITTFFDFIPFPICQLYGTSMYKRLHNGSVGTLRQILYEEKMIDSVTNICKDFCLSNPEINTEDCRVYGVYVYHLLRKAMETDIDIEYEPTRPPIYSILTKAIGVVVFTVLGTFYLVS